MDKESYRPFHLTLGRVHRVVCLKSPVTLETLSPGTVGLPCPLGDALKVLPSPVVFISTVNENLYLPPVQMFPPVGLVLASPNPRVLQPLPSSDGSSCRSRTRVRRSRVPDRRRHYRYTRGLPCTKYFRDFGPPLRRSLPSKVSGPGSLVSRSRPPLIPNPLTYWSW